MMPSASAVTHIASRATVEAHKAALESGGGGGNDGDMRERLATVEALLPTLATKADMGELRADFERGQKENRTWMIATVIALFLGILGVGNFLAAGFERQASAPGAQPAPIIIQVPAPTLPPAN